MKPLTRNILLASMGLLLAAALITLVAISNRSRKDVLCNGVKISVSSDSLGVLTEKDIQDFMTLHVTPSTHKPIADINLTEIESQLSEMPLVATVECYIDNKDYLCVEVSEMIPMMHVYGGNHDYCVDIDAHQMPTPSKLREGVATVDGTNVSLQFATGDLFDLISYIHQNGLSHEFTEFRVGAGNKVSMRSNLYGYWVAFGVPEGIARKFDKLARFRKSVPDHTKYKEINLDYYGQVICK